METSPKQTLLDTLQALPERCGARDMSTNAPIMIVLGERGYYPAPPAFDPEGYNFRRGISDKQVSAMMVGSMFGWTVPGVAAELKA